MKIKTRFAPSPTGYPLAARVLLFTPRLFAHIRRWFVLRIEDTAILGGTFAGYQADGWHELAELEVG